MTFLAISFLLFTSFSVIFGQCPTGQVHGPNGNCYQAFSSGSSWYQAEATCVQNGGHIASIGDVFTGGFIDGLAGGAFTGVDYWLGGTTNFLETSWSWTDFTNFTYLNWGLGYPINNVGYCLAVRLSDAKWASMTCSQSKPFVCEYLQTQSTICGKNWLYAPTMKKCYFAATYSNIDWTSASSICANYGGNLATIHSLAENSLVSGYAASVMGSYDNYYLWIGLYSPSNNGVYQWADDTIVDFTHWYDNKNVTSNIYVYLQLYGTYDNAQYAVCNLNRWYAQNSDSGINGYICEKKIQ